MGYFLILVLGICFAIGFSLIPTIIRDFWDEIKTIYKEGDE